MRCINSCLRSQSPSPQPLPNLIDGLREHGCSCRSYEYLLHDFKFCAYTSQNLLKNLPLRRTRNEMMLLDIFNPFLESCGQPGYCKEQPASLLALCIGRYGQASEHPCREYAAGHQGDSDLSIHRVIIQSLVDTTVDPSLPQLPILEAEHQASMHPFG